MLVIRKEQIECLHRSALTRHVQRWALEFRIELPLETQRYSDAGLEKLLRKASAAAQIYGFEDEFLRREYLRVVLRTGSGADGRPTDPSVRAVVEDSASSPTERMDRLAVLVPDKDQAEQNRIALAKAGSGQVRPPLPQRSNTEPDLPIESRFFKVDGREAAPEPDEAEP